MTLLEDLSPFFIPLKAAEDIIIKPASLIPVYKADIDAFGVRPLFDCISNSSSVYGFS